MKLLKISDLANGDFFEIEPYQRVWFMKTAVTLNDYSMFHIASRIIATSNNDYEVDKLYYFESASMVRPVHFDLYTHEGFVYKSTMYQEQLEKLD